MARKFLAILTAIVVVFVIVWCGLWFFGSKTIAAVIAKTDRSLGGLVATCSSPAVSGFPFRFDIGCSSLDVTDKARGVTATVPGLAASALLYKPGRVMATALGPVKIDAGSLHLTANAGWTAAAARADLWLSGLSGFATTLDTGRLVLESTTGPLLPIHVVEFKRGEMELAPSRAAADSLNLTLSVASLHIERPNGRTLPEVTANVDATALSSGSSVGTDPSAQLAAWIDAGGKLQIDQMDVSSSGTSLRIKGTLSVAKSGLLSGRLNLQILGLNSIQTLAEALVPGSGDQAEKVAGALKQLTKSVSTPDGTAQEIDLTIKNGDVSYGVIPIMYPDAGHIVRLSIPPLFAART